MNEGLFIVLEGVDGAGTTTHTGRVAKRLRNDGLPVHTTHEPSDGPIGLMLRQILTGRLIVPSSQGGRPPRWETMALLFAADRVDHIESEIMPNLKDGVMVISDRYDHSSVAYQSTNASRSSTAPQDKASQPNEASQSSDAERADETVEWVRNINKHARRPDLVIVLDVPAEVALDRRSGRTTKKEMYDGDELQKSLSGFYQDIERHFPEDKIVHVDASGTLQETGAAVLAEIARLRG